MSKQKIRPDYGYWSKFDIWSLKEAALLLHNLEPSEYLNVRFNSKEIPEASELKNAHKTFLLLKKTIHFEHVNSAHPRNIFTVASQKDLEIPEGLRKEFISQHNREKEIQAQIQSQSQSAKTDKELATRERNTFLKMIGLLIHMLIKRSPRFMVNDRANASQILQAILDQAESMGVDTAGLKSVDRKITEALKFLEEEKESEYQD